MKKILINLLPFRSKNFNGVENYVKGILSELNNDYYLVFLCQLKFPLKEILPSGYNNYKIILVPFTLKPIFRVLIEQFILSILSFYFELIYSPFNAGVIIHRKRCKSIITIHDMLPFNINCKYSFARKHYIRLITRLSFNSADMIITVSNFTKNNIIDHLGNKKKIVVIYNSVDRIESYKDVKINFRYFLIIGGVNKDKNIDKLLYGFKLFLDNHNNLNKLPIKLFIIGANQGYLKEILSLIDILGLSENVKYLGYVSNSDKEILLRGCVSLFMMGNEEGFGIPALELLQHYKLPIITPKGALLEVCDKFSIIADPNSPEEISESIFKSLYAVPSFRKAELEAHLLKFSRIGLSSFFIKLLFSHNFMSK